MSSEHRHVHRYTGACDPLRDPGLHFLPRIPVYNPERSKNRFPRQRDYQKLPKDTWNRFTNTYDTEWGVPAGRKRFENLRTANLAAEQYAAETLGSSDDEDLTADEFLRLKQQRRQRKPEHRYKDPPDELMQAIQK